jgi:hypothetical protein
MLFKFIIAMLVDNVDSSSAICTGAKQYGLHVNNSCNLIQLTAAGVRTSN